MFGKVKPGDGSGSEYDFGDQVVQIWTWREWGTDAGGHYYQRVRTVRLGDAWFLVGEAADQPGHENPYRGVTFWLPVGEVGRLRVHASMAAAMQSWQTYQRLYPNPPGEAKPGQR